MVLWWICYIEEGGEVVNTLMETLRTDDALVELDDIDDLWYLIRGATGAWFVGSGNG
jgi:YydF family exported signaling peptide